MKPNHEKSQANHCTGDHDLDAEQAIADCLQRYGYTAPLEELCISEQMVFQEINEETRQLLYQTCKIYVPENPVASYSSSEDGNAHEEPQRD